MRMKTVSLSLILAVTICSLSYSQNQQQSNIRNAALTNEWDAINAYLLTNTADTAQTVADAKAFAARNLCTNDDFRDLGDAARYFADIDRDNGKSWKSSAAQQNTSASQDMALANAFWEINQDYVNGALWYASATAWWDMEVGGLDCFEQYGMAEGFLLSAEGLYDEATSYYEQGQMEP